jgi:hypothetical protein
MELSQLPWGTGKPESRLCDCVIWWVQDITDSCSICFAVLCIESLLFPNRREEARRERKKIK